MTDERDAAQRWGIRNDELELEAELARYAESTPMDGGTLGADRLARAVEWAREHLKHERAVRRVFSREMLVLICDTVDGAEDTVIRKWVVTSIGRDRARCLENLVRAMRAIRANPDELAVGNRAHLPLAWGYGVACLFLPGTRRPLGPAEFPATRGDGERGAGREANGGNPAPPLEG